MDITLALYLIDVLDTTKGVAIIGLVLLTITSVIIGLMAYCDSNTSEDEIVIKKAFSSLLKITLLLLIISILIPSQKTMYLMASTEAAKSVLANPEVKKIGDKVTSIINEKLDEILKKEGK